MGEDKLTHAQRLRLESLAQAMNTAMLVRIAPSDGPPGTVTLRDKPVTMADLFKRAEEIEEWLLAAKELAP